MKPRNTAAVALVLAACGILQVAACLLPILPVIALVLAVTATRQGGDKSLARAAFVLGLIGLAISSAMLSYIALCQIFKGI